MPKQGTSKAHSDAPGEEAVQRNKTQPRLAREQELLHPERSALALPRSRKNGAKLEKDWEAHGQKIRKGISRSRARVRTDTRSGQAARWLGKVAAEIRRRRGQSDACLQRRGHQRYRGHDPAADRRLGRSDPVEQHVHQVVRRFSAGQISRAAISTSASASTRWARP